MNRSEWYFLLCTLLSFVVMFGGVFLAATSCQDRVITLIGNGQARCDPGAVLTVYTDTSPSYAICSCPKDTP